MKKILATLFAIMLMAVAVVAIKPNGPSAVNGLNGKGTEQLYLYEKDSSWDPVPGAWGQMTFDEDSFVFNGHGLESGVEYTLIRYVEPWNTPDVVLGQAMANNGGNVHISGELLDGGYKIWLVLSDDVVGGNLVGWNPSEYLFEYNTI